MFFEFFWGILDKTSFMTTLKNLKLWGGDEDRIFQIEDETLRIIDAKEIEGFQG